MHSAPSVTYPVGRSRGATRILIATWALGAGCAGLSCYLFDSAGWRQLLLVRLTQPGRASRWIWIEQRAMPERWRDLRRAVYSRAPSASPAGEPWRATAPADAP